MSRFPLMVGVATIVMFASACSDSTAPIVDDFELPEPDLSLDPERLSVGEYIATPCDLGIWGNGLEHLRDRHDRVIVDVYFGRESPGGPWDGPTEGDVALVTAHGGKVLYRFNVPAVRARITLSQVRGLVQKGSWVTVRDVPDAARYDVPSLGVGFTRPLRDSDVELYESLGGRVEYRFDFINELSGTLPDRSVPVLREWSDVKYIQAHGVMCLA